MYSGGVLKRVDGLTYDKLKYFVRAGYVRPRKIRKKTLDYNDFSEEDVELIKRAWEFISRHHVRTGTAFERARVKDQQLSLNMTKQPKNSLP